MKIFITVSLFFLCSQADAKKFLVTSNNDAGPNTLRQAILDANAQPGKDTIEITTTGTILLETNPNPLSINILGPATDSLCIFGNGIILEAAVTGRFFQSNEYLHVQDVQFQKATAILNAGVVWSIKDAVFKNCVFDMNSAPGGGGVLRNTGNNSVLFDQCLFKSNISTGDGGAIHFRNNGVLTIKDCSFEGNTAGGNGNAITLHNATLRLEGMNIFDAVVPVQDIYGDSGSTVILDPGMVVPIGGSVVISILP